MTYGVGTRLMLGQHSFSRKCSKMLKKRDNLVDSIMYLLDPKENRNVLIIFDSKGSRADTAAH